MVGNDQSAIIHHPSSIMGHDTRIPLQGALPGVSSLLNFLRKLLTRDKISVFIRQAFPCCAAFTAMLGSLPLGPCATEVAAAVAAAPLLLSPKRGHPCDLDSNSLTVCNNEMKAVAEMCADLMQALPGKKRKKLL